jgi:hypothetical protein
MDHKKTPEELWSMQMAKLKLIYSHIHDDDFEYDYGRKETMMTQLQQKLGKSREELNELLRQL